MKKGAALNGDFKISSRLQERLKPVNQMPASIEDKSIPGLTRRDIDLVVFLLSKQAENIRYLRETGHYKFPADRPEYPKYNDCASYLRGQCQTLSWITRRDPALQYLVPILDKIRDNLKLDYRLLQTPELK